MHLFGTTKYQCIFYIKSTKVRQDETKQYGVHYDSVSIEKYYLHIFLYDVSDQIIVLK